jgi:HD-GYP domain-containing protein (c-di-GMP phosphodiesterase class II)
MLLRRVALGAVIIGIVLAAVAFLLESRRQNNEIADLVMAGADEFNVLAQDLLDRPGLAEAEAFQQRLDEFLAAGPVRRRLGRFVMIAVYDPAGRELAEADVPDHEPIDEIRRRMAEADRASREAIYGSAYRVRIEGRPHVHVAAPLSDSRGNAVAQIEAVFSISIAAMADMQKRMMIAVVAVFGVVLVTIVLIYPIISRLLGRLARMTTELLDANLQTLEVLGSAIAKRDNDTDAHNYRVTLYSVRIAEHVGLPRSEIRTLIKGAFLHDVGKIGIRDKILLKPGKLDDAEFEIMKTHVGHGLEITERAGWLTDAAQVVGAHHEKFAGGGYPKGLLGDNTPVTARIFAIADVFDALASRRPYKEPMPFDETMEILEQGRGTHFDPMLLDAFKKIARELYDQYAGKEGDEPRRDLDKVTQRYFREDVAELMA